MLTDRQTTTQHYIKNNYFIVPPSPLPDVCCLLWLGSQEFLLEVGGGLVRSCSPPEPAPPDPDLQQHLQGRGAQLNSYQEFGTLLNVKWFSEGLER